MYYGTVLVVPLDFFHSDTDVHENSSTLFIFFKNRLPTTTIYEYKYCTVLNLLVSASFQPEIDTFCEICKKALSSLLIADALMYSWSEFFI